MQYKVVSLNRGSSLSECSPEQIHLDRIYNFKFVNCYVKAEACERFKTESCEGSLSATDVCKQLCTLAQMVISYLHLVTVWMKFVTHKNKAEVKSVDKWLTHRVVIGHEVIDQGRCFSQKN